MERPAWERSKRNQLKRYRRRRPEETVLYRIIYHYRDELDRRWDELFLEQYGSLRREVLDALDRYLSCGILAHGCARARCEQCNHSQLIALRSHLKACGATWIYYRLQMVAHSYAAPLGIANNCHPLAAGVCGPILLSTPSTDGC